MSFCKSTQKLLHSHYRCDTIQQSDVYHLMLVSKQFEQMTVRQEVLID